MKNVNVEVAKNGKWLRAEDQIIIKDDDMKWKSNTKKKIRSKNGRLCITNAKYDYWRIWVQSEHSKDNNRDLDTEYTIFTSTTFCHSKWLNLHVDRDGVMPL